MKKLLLLIFVFVSLQSFGQFKVDKNDIFTGVKKSQVVNGDTITNPLSMYHPGLHSIKMMNGDINRVQWLKDIDLAKWHRQMAKNWDTASDICFAAAGVGALVSMFVLKDPVKYSEQVPGYRDYEYLEKVNDRRKLNHWIAGTFTGIGVIGGLFCGLKSRYHKNQLDFHISPYEVGIGLNF